MRTISAKVKPLAVVACIALACVWWFVAAWSDSEGAPPRSVSTFESGELGLTENVTLEGTVDVPRAILDAEITEYGGLLDRLAHTEDLEYAKYALQVLGEQSSKADEVLPRLLGLTRDVALEARPALLHAAANLLPYTTLTEERLTEILNPFDAFLWSDLRAATPELRAAILNERDRLTHRRGIYAHNTSTERLVELLYSDRPYFQEVAAALLAKLDRPASSHLSDLSFFLEEVRPAELQAWAPEDLRELQFYDSGELLVYPAKTAQISYEHEIKSAVADAIAKIASGDTEVSLTVEAYRLLHDPGAERRVLAAARLGNLGSGDKRAVPHLIGALIDKDDQVVLEAITALGMMGPDADEAIPILQRLSMTGRPRIANRAKAALRQIRDG